MSSSSDCFSTVKVSPVEASSGMSGVSMGAMVDDAGDPAPGVARSWVLVEGGDGVLGWSSKAGALFDDE